MSIWSSLLAPRCVRTGKHSLSPCKTRPVSTHREHCEANACEMLYDLFLAIFVYLFFYSNLLRHAFGSSGCCYQF